MLIGISGKAGSGKTAFANKLYDELSRLGVPCNIVSFAGPTKDVVASLFDFPREMLEGDSESSRKWRELPNRYWSDKLGQSITPRQMLQMVGTDLIRNQVDSNFWIYRLLPTLDSNIVNIIGDCRFVNELEICDITILIDRDGVNIDNHESEVDFVKWDNFDFKIDNNGTLKELEDSARWVAHNVYDSEKSRVHKLNYII